MGAQALCRDLRPGRIGFPGRAPAPELPMTSFLSGLVSWFVRVNRRACLAIERTLPCARPNPSQLYSQVAGELLRGLPRGALVVDVGGGRRCAVAGFRPEGVRIVAVDSSADELALNHEVAETRVADAARELPFAAGECDMVISKHVLEHLQDVRAFLRESARVLRPGGWSVHFMPARRAAFAFLRRLAPVVPVGRVMAVTHPEVADERRFAAHYDRCVASIIEADLRSSGFSVRAVWPSYYQSHYFAFLLPFYVVSAVWDMFCWLLDLKDMAAYLVIVARRRS